MSGDRIKTPGRRAHPRVSLALQVGYRTTGAFLVSYTVDLSGGGLYIESTDPLPEGTQLELTMGVPGVPEPVRLQGVVVWTQRAEMGGHPPGMGIQFQGVEATFGELIDTLVKQFSGLHVLVAGASPRSRAQIIRYLRSCLAVATVIEQEPQEPLSRAFEPPLDLLVVDLEEAEADGLLLLRSLRQGGYPTAAVVLSASVRLRQEARDAGADEAISSPAQLTDFRAAVIRALARPVLLAAPPDEE